MNVRTQMAIHVLWTMLSIMAMCVNSQGNEVTLSRLEEKLRSHENTVGTLRKRLSQLERRAGSQANSPSGGRRWRARKSKRGFMYGGGRNIILNDGYSKEIGFHTALTKTQSFRHRDTIKFDHVITNLGEAFSKQTGVFTCPVTGTYLFNLNILCDSLGYMEAAIVHNDIPIFKAVSYNRAPGTFNSGSGSAIVRLLKDDKVRVIMVKPKASAETLLGGFSHFSGYLLKAV